MEIPYEIIDATAFEKDKIYLLNVKLNGDTTPERLQKFGTTLRDIFKEKGIEVIINFSNTAQVTAQEIKEPEVIEYNER